MTSLHCSMCTVNPNDIIIPAKLLDLHFEVNFDGIKLSLFEKQEEVMHTAVTGENTLCVV